MATKTTASIVTPELLDAALEFSLRRSRLSHPAGVFDGARRFHLSEDEQSQCCATIRTPSRAHPFSEMVHGRTALHVASLRGVEQRDLKRVAKDEPLLALARVAHMADELPRLEAAAAALAEPVELHQAVAALLHDRTPWAEAVVHARALL